MSCRSQSERKENLPSYSSRGCEIALIEIKSEIALIKIQSEVNACAFPLHSIVDLETLTFLLTIALQH